MTKTVIVIGAGLAGLSAALELHRAGWPVVVLEARNRVGGRCYTFRGFEENQYAEAGGEFIDEGHQRMHTLARDFGLVLESEPGGWNAEEEYGVFLGRNGWLKDKAVWGLDLHASNTWVWAQLAKLANKVPNPYAPLTAPEAAELDQRTAADWLTSLSLPELGRLSFEARIRAEYTVEAHQFSMLDLARNAAMYYHTETGRGVTARIRGGNDLLPQAMARVLPDVRLNAPVVKVAQSATGVEVTYQTTTGFETMSGAWAVLAVPLTTARHIEFSPALPTAHEAMVQKLQYGSVTKVCVQFSRRWWQERGWAGHMMNDAPLACTWNPTEVQTGERGILTAYTGGAPGAALAQLSDAERIETVVRELERLFPGARELVLSAKTIAWPNEPYTRGAYAAYAPGDITRYWEPMYSPAGRLFFAGEHIAAYQGYMEGAVESGQRVAGIIRGLEN
ncbi:MAG: FAD-dependent oxidoreductase [Anaerolineales bacterium]|nr:FAD-dependent oxidoreductase [Anaerolineales bacterium]